MLSDCYDILDVGISEYKNQNIDIYPNPTTGIVHVVHGGQESIVQLVDVFGKELMSQSVGVEFELPLDDFPSGIYFMKLNGRLFKLIKQ